MALQVQRNAREPLESGGPGRGLLLPVVADGGPDAGTPALAKDELICVHRALMPSLSLAPGGSISGTVRLQNGGDEQRGSGLLQAAFTRPSLCFQVTR